MQAFFDLFLSTDFLLNITAEAIGVLCEVVLVTVIIQRYLDRKASSAWRSVFTKRTRKLLESHKEMPMQLSKPLAVGEQPVAIRLLLWKRDTEQLVNFALDTIPVESETPNEYALVELYAELLTQMRKDWLSKQLSRASLEKLNQQAMKIAQAIGSKDSIYLWTEDQIETIWAQHQAQEIGT